MRVVLENAKQRPHFSHGMDVLVLALSSAGVLEYMPGVITARESNGSSHTFNVVRNDGRFEQHVAPNRLKLEHLDLGNAPAQMEPDESSKSENGHGMLRQPATTENGHRSLLEDFGLIHGLMGRLKVRSLDIRCECHLIFVCMICAGVACRSALPTTRLCMKNFSTSSSKRNGCVDRRGALRHISKRCGDSRHAVTHIFTHKWCTLADAPKYLGPPAGRS